MARRGITREKFKSLFTLAAGFGVSSAIIFKNRVFNFVVVIEPTHRELIFQNCLFKENVIFKRGVKTVRVTDNEEIDLFEASNILTNEFDESITFNEKCQFDKKLILKDILFTGKFSLHNCKVKEFDFTNATFNNLADFWKTTFLNKATFYKTDFNATAVFSMVTFEENVLFTYSLLAGKSIFSKTYFKKGFDLSQAIISGELKFFDLNINCSDFKSVYFHKKNKEYQNAIDIEGVIPLENKQETFRLLKYCANSNGDGIAASRYKVFEYRSYNSLIWHQLYHGHHWISNLANIPMMFLNRITNNYGSNFWLGVIFTICVAGIFLNSMLTASAGYEYTWQLSNWQWDKLVTLLNPLHKITDLNNNPNMKLYVLDFLSRIAIGYGIYQTVQAFRKFK
ncbi:hypothetical protein [Mesonia sp.]|uniref:hypothetical protein n=1 Tax=Mesonia sp. TaxID=1960830 RepID=UPI003F9E92E9